MREAHQLARGVWVSMQEAGKLDKFVYIDGTC